ncbi:hypothetical protein B0A48_14477 [Cryoendolithus antarcticus]|uniref:Cleavage and polyadenylation specificity factor subunit 2 n=1 Tax=Cryoendolithus antarcticus TaxID=1507870 RepID=A0A1V8SKZ9_9PEZI|nr:hypothetical protein B0A48_14477 [Cryoendolithus antarcticus]
MFTFTPLLGAHSPSSTGSSSLLELDGGVKVLVDIGWDSSFDTTQLIEVERHTSTLSVILLTHATLDHLGAYAHCCKHIPLFDRIPVYATTPVVNLGRSLLEDLYGSAPAAAGLVPASALGAGSAAGEDSPQFLLQAPTAEEIAGYFSRINVLKYSQPHQPVPSPFSPPLGGLTVTAYSAGHTLGGTIWHLQHGLESIVYAADWNQTKESLLPEAAWLSAGGSEVIEPLQSPTALVCSARGVEKSHVIPRKQRDESLIALVRETISQGGKVLIPTDSSARVLELAFILNQTWRENMDGPHAATYRNTKIYLASKSAKSTMRYVQSMLEWMNEGVMRDAEAAMNAKVNAPASGPLDWKHVSVIDRQSQLERAMRKKHPSIILASDTSMTWGFARQAIELLAEDARNLVILPERVTATEDGAASGLGEQIWQHWASGTSHVSSHSGVKVVDSSGSTLRFRHSEVASLESNETQLYNQYLARQRQLHSTQQGNNTGSGELATADLIDEAASESSESSDEDQELQGKALNLSTQMTASQKRKGGLTTEDLGINILLKGKGIHDYDVRDKRGREKVFPLATRRHRADDFGELIKPEDYLRAEERDEIDGVDLRDQTALKDAAVGQKRKWGDDGGRENSKQQNNKRSRLDRPGKSRAPDDIDAAIARATGEAMGNGATKESSALTNGDEDSPSEEESDYEPEDPDSQGPRKLVYTTQELTLNCKLAHVDFSGTFEKRDFLMLLPLIRPRKLVLMSASTSELDSLSTECKALMTRDGSDAEKQSVFAPRNGEAVDMSVDTNAWSLKISRKLARKLIWQNVKGLGIVALSGVLKTEPDVEGADDAMDEDDGTAKKKLKLAASLADSKMEREDPDAHLPVLEPIAASAQAGVPVARDAELNLHVGDLRITDLRALLRAQGHTAEFRGEGTLLVDGCCVVRKGAQGRIEVEGGVGSGSNAGLVRRDHGNSGMGTFWQVKKAVYGGLAVVGGAS